MNTRKIFFISFVLFGLLACSEPDLPAAQNEVSSAQELHQETITQEKNIAWAVNLGGDQVQGGEGIVYERDQYELSARKGQIESMKGAQEATIYKSYRVGEMRLARAIENGVYDVIFRFAEPDEIGVGERVFDVLAEGQIVVPELDVRLARDGNIRSSLDRTVTDISVTDGQLDITFNGIKGEPILNGLVVMKKPADQKEAWDLVWSDEFNESDVLDQSKWTFDIWPARKVNDEEQSYTNNSENVRIEDGLLVIEAHHADGEITSGRVHTAGKGDLLYGRVEVRAKLPSGQGTWPAIWMLPTDPFRYASNCGEGTDWQGNSECDAWPNSGEIDIMEHVGYDPNLVHGTVHTKAFYWVNGEQRKASVETKNAIDEFHVYAMEWSPERIDVFFNDARYFTYLKQSDKWEEWPFDHPFHLILNVAVGGGWGSAGGPTDLSAFPTRMLVDYVRMYKPSSQSN